MAKTNNKKYQDKTAAKRVKSRRERIKRSGLVERLVVLDQDDLGEVKEFARGLYEKKGKKLNDE